MLRKKKGTIVAECPKEDCPKKDEPSVRVTEPDLWVAYGKKVYAERYASLREKDRVRYVKRVAKGENGWLWSAHVEYQDVEGGVEYKERRTHVTFEYVNRYRSPYSHNMDDYFNPLAGTPIVDPRLTNWKSDGTRHEQGVETTKIAAEKAAREAAARLEFGDPKVEWQDLS